MDARYRVPGTRPGRSPKIATCCGVSQTTFPAITQPADPPKKSWPPRRPSRIRTSYPTCPPAGWPASYPDIRSSAPDRERRRGSTRSTSRGDGCGPIPASGGSTQPIARTDGDPKPATDDRRAEP